jgi:hypothetical protein
VIKTLNFIISKKLQKSVAYSVLYIIVQFYYCVVDNILWIYNYCIYFIYYMYARVANAHVNCFVCMDINDLVVI